MGQRARTRTFTAGKGEAYGAASDMANCASAGVLARFEGPGRAKVWRGRAGLPVGGLREEERGREGGWVLGRAAGDGGPSALLDTQGQ